MDNSHNTCVLLLNLPPQSLGGIDLISFQTTPRFQGIKYLPPSWHFIFASTSATSSERHGAWFRIKGNGSDVSYELHIKKWDTSKEELVDETSSTEIMRWRANLGSIWKDRLTPYRQSASNGGEAQEEKGDWALLTDCISESMLSRIIRDGTADHWVLTSASSAKRDEDDIPGLNGSEARDALQHEKELYLLPINLKQTWRAGATGRERTEAAQDRSWALSELIAQHCTDGNEMEILGEMQFCFLMILTLNNYSCLEQWKRILSLLFTCKSAVVERTKLFVQALITLKVQLQHCQDAEGGLFDLREEGAPLLKDLLRRFKKGLGELQGTGKQDVLDELEELESFMKEHYGWDLEDSFARTGMLELEDGEQVEMDVSGYDEDLDEIGEYAPVVVELTQEQLRVLPTDDGGGEYIHHEVAQPDGMMMDEEDEEDDQDLEDMDARY